MPIRCKGNMIREIPHLGWYLLSTGWSRAHILAAPLPPPSIQNKSRSVLGTIIDGHVCWNIYTTYATCHLLFPEQGKQRSIFISVCSRQIEVCCFLYRFTEHKRKMLFSVSSVFHKQNSGNVETWKWRHWDMEMETWRRRHGDIDIET